MPLPLASPMIGPVLGLNLWTFFMEGWMYATRLPAMKEAKLEPSPAMTKQDIDKVVPLHVRWKADNYNHLMEQPTQFYAVALALALAGHNNKTDVQLAWTYVGLRILHSLVQALGNKILLRFSVFAGSSFVLFGLTARGAMAYFF